MTLTIPSTNNDTGWVARDKPQAIINHDKFHNLQQLKPGQPRWKYERALKLSLEFDDLAAEDTWVAFWTRENVVKAVEKGDANMVNDWLLSKIKCIEFGLENYAQYRREAKGVN